MAQAALIGARQFDQVDWENVAEEIESVGRRERGEYESHLIRILAHLIKWEAQPERRGMSWWLSIMDGRDNAERFLKANPSLKPHLEEIFHDALKYARRQAERETGLRRAQVTAIALSYEDAVSKPIDRPEPVD